MIAGLVLAGLVVSAYLAGRWPRNGSILLIVMSLLWLGNNKSVEGPVLIAFNSERGIVAADLGGLVGLGIAALVLLVGERRR